RVDPATVRRFGGDAQSGEEGNAGGCDQQPVQDDGPVVGLALSHVRAPWSGRPRARLARRRLVWDRATFRQEAGLLVRKLSVPQDLRIRRNGERKVLSRFCS